MTATTAAHLPPIEQPLEDGWTLPASWYADPDVLALERERIFSSGWTYAAPAEWLAEPGSYLAAQIGHVPIVLVRGRDELLRGFVNVCRHRGHLVVEGSGCRGTLQCPYHAWTYDLDGSLRRAPRSEREPGFDHDALSLRPIAVDTWGPFVFASPDPDAPPLAEALGELPEILARSGLDVGELRFHSHHEWPISANWKVALENYLECYHCPAAHPGFSTVVDVSPDAYRLEVHPTFSSQLGPVRASALAGNGAAYTPRGPVTESQYHFLFPATTVNVAPGFPNISLERWIPDGPRRTVEVTDYFFAPDVPEAEIAELLAWDSQVAEEDVSLVESVQRGLDSGTIPQGRLLLGSERLIADFQRRVRDALLGP
ncbi:MAG: aromatic ring-hydroxylating dioxygenase subunit alpha [Thermoleophilia bacterium]|nr:aromatic ring-hydroxylating dioxygenase subunit alpha [Gaiellaceae bacterium]MDW8338444.1 aromatic ring-hydroxylating dioxygenase subunit alpha [Thermoleophilia bacterium]